MYTNEFGQTVKADWILLSVTTDQLALLSKNVLRLLAKGAEVEAEVITNDESIRIEFSTEEKVARDIVKEHLGHAYEMTGQMLIWIFGETAEFYNFDDNGDLLIRVEFDSYIKRVHGL